MDGNVNLNMFKEKFNEEVVDDQVSPLALHLSSHQKLCPEESQLAAMAEEESLMPFPSGILRFSEPPANASGNLDGDQSHEKFYGPRAALKRENSFEDSFATTTTSVKSKSGILEKHESDLQSVLNAEVFRIDDGVCGGNIRFEVIDTQISEDPRRRYVLYVVLVLRGTGTDPLQTCVEKRYRDFRKLHLSLIESFPRLMATIGFPKKVLFGNFTQKLIDQRSREFEVYLAHLTSLAQIRSSTIFIRFFCGLHEHRSIQMIKAGHFRSSMMLLRHVLAFKLKLCDFNEQLKMFALCTVICNNSGFAEQAHLYVEAALLRLPENGRSHFLVPFLMQKINFCKRRGEDFAEITQRLDKLKANGVILELCPTLEQSAFAAFSVPLGTKNLYS